MNSLWLAGDQTGHAGDRFDQGQQCGESARSRLGKMVLDQSVERNVGATLSTRGGNKARISIMVGVRLRVETAGTSFEPGKLANLQWWC